MRTKRLRDWILISVLLAIVAGFSRAEQIKLSRSEVVIDFKDEGYYKTIPFIALQNDLFFISDNFNHRVLEYRMKADQLEFIRTIGRPGQGPGDLMRPMDISVFKDTLAVKDERGISFFGFDGIFKSKFPLLSKSVAMVLAEGSVYSANYDSKNSSLIQSYDASGGVLNTFLKKSSLYALKPEIHRGISPDYLERVAYEGILIYAEGKLFYLNKRFGDVAKIDLANAKLAVKSIVPLMSKAEKAKADENRRMFLEEGYDLEKNEGNIPHNYLFEDARIWHGRLFLLLENFDILEKKPRQFTEIIEIDLESWTVVNSYRAMAAAKNESASNILILGDGKEPEFLMTIRVPGDDSKLWIFRPER